MPVVLFSLRIGHDTRDLLWGMWEVHRDPGKLGQGGRFAWQIKRIEINDESASFFFSFINPHPDLHSALSTRLLPARYGTTPLILIRFEDQKNESANLVMTFRAWMQGRRVSFVSSNLGELTKRFSRCAILHSSVRLLRSQLISYANPTD